MGGEDTSCNSVRWLSKWEKHETTRLESYLLKVGLLSPIELEWQHLKKDELASKTFEDELDLAYAVIDGVQTRGEKGNYSTQRVKFNSHSSA